MDAINVLQPADISHVLFQLKELAAKYSQLQQQLVVLEKARDWSENEKAVLHQQVSQLTSCLKDSQDRLEQSEQSRLSLQRDLDNCHKVYEAELRFLKTRLHVCEDDCRTARHELEAVKADLSAARRELSITQNQGRLHDDQLTTSNQRTMQEILRRRQQALDGYRREYERQHPLHDQQQRGVYQRDSAHDLQLDGEDEID